MNTPQSPASGDDAGRAANRRQSVEVAAYFKAQQRGFAPGGELDDWLEAEAEMALLAASLEEDEAAIQTFGKKLDEELKEWHAKLSRLIDSTQPARKELRAELQLQLDALEKRRAEFRARLDEVRKQGTLAWSDVKTGLESAWKDLRASLDQSASRFK